MSRSYKKTPRSGEQKNKVNKKLANKKLRRHPIDSNIPFNNKQYKKDFCSWDICDYEEVGISFDVYYERLVQQWHRWHTDKNKKCPTREEAYKNYVKWYLRK